MLEYSMDKKEMLMLRLEGRTYKYIADKAGVTRQRIQQVISPPPAIRDYIVRKYNGYCMVCGIHVGLSGHVHHLGSNNGEDYNDIDNLELLCLSCHRTKHAIPKKCKGCGTEIRGLRKYCSEKCRRSYYDRLYKVELVCANCEKPFLRGGSAVRGRLAPSHSKRNRSNRYFCSRRCQGEYIGKNYGFAAHPENRTRNFVSKYVVYRTEIIERLANGEKLHKIAKDIGYKSDNVSTLKKIIDDKLSEPTEKKGRC